MYQEQPCTSKDAKVVIKKRKTTENSTKKASEGLRTSFHGVVYQLILLIMCIVRAANKKYSIDTLDTEAPDAGKFDDVVFKYKENNNWKVKYIQAKHTQDEKHEEEKIKFSSLLNDNERNKFNIRKYFKSFLDITKKAKEEHLTSEDFVICTNIDFDFDDHGTEVAEEDFQEETGKNDNTAKEIKNKNIFKLSKGGKVLYMELLPYDDELLSIGKSKTYKFASEGKFLETNKETIKSFFELKSKILKSTKKRLKKRDEVDFDLQMKANNVDSMIEDFITKIYFVVNHPTNVELRKFIKTEIKTIDDNFNLRDPSLVFDFLHAQMTEWLEKNVADPFNKSQIGNIIKSIASTICSQQICGNTFEFTKILEEKGIEFNIEQQEILTFLDSELKSFNLVTGKYPLLIGSLLVLQAIKQSKKFTENDSYTFVRDSTFHRLKDKYIEALKARQYDLVAIQCDSKKDIEEIFKITDASKRKLILISKEIITPTSIVLNHKLELKNIKLFSSLTEKSQKRILDSLVCFQGKELKLRDFFENLSDFSVLDKLFQNNSFELLVENCFEIGEIPPSDEKYFVPRKYFQKIFIAPKNFQKKVLDEEKFLSEATDNIVAILDNPGVGKTTAINHLVGVLKERNPNIWIIKRKVANLHFENISIDAAINEICKGFSSYEKELFSYFLINKRVIIIFDGLDEVNETVQIKFSEIFKILSDYSKQLWISSRKLSKKLRENHFKISKENEYSLNLLGKNNSKLMIKKYYCYLLKKEFKRSREKEITNFVNKIFKHFDKTVSKVPFCGDALSTRMLAEIYEKNFIDNYQNKNEHQLFNFNDILEFFRLFIQRKAEIYLSKSEGCSLQTRYFVENLNIIDNHCFWALKTLLNGEDIYYLQIPQVKELKIEEIVHFGILLDNNGEPEFINIMFAEYFIAQLLSKILHDKQMSNNRSTQSVVIKLLDEGGTIIKFLNYFLKIDPISDEILNFWGEPLALNLKNAIELNVEENLFETAVWEENLQIFEFILESVLKNDKDVVKKLLLIEYTDKEGNDSLLLDDVTELIGYYKIIEYMKKCEFNSDDIKFVIEKSNDKDIREKLNIFLVSNEIMFI